MNARVDIQMSNKERRGMGGDKGEREQWGKEEDKVWMMLKIIFL